MTVGPPSIRTYEAKYPVAISAAWVNPIVEVCTTAGPTVKTDHKNLSYAYLGTLAGVAAGLESAIKYHNYLHVCQLVPPLIVVVSTAGNQQVLGQ